MKGTGALSGGTFTRPLIPFVRAEPHDPVSSQGAHLLISSLRGGRISTCEFGGGRNTSVHSKTPAPKYLKYMMSLIGDILVSYGCHNKLPLAWCFQIIEMYFLIVLKFRSLKSRCLPGSFSL